MTSTPQTGARSPGAASHSSSVSRATAPTPRFRDAVTFEWVKMRSIRSTRWTAVALSAAFPLLSMIVAATESLAPDDTILGASVLGGAALAQTLAVVLGSLLVTSEIRTGTMRSTLLAQPNRLTVLTAKALVASAAVFAVTLPSVLLAYGLGLVMLDRDAYATGQPFPAVVGVALAISTLAVLGTGLGTIVRHSAGAVASGVAIVLGPGLLAPMLGDLQRWVGGASLSGVLQKLTQSSDATPEAVGTLGAWPSLLVVAAYTTIVVVGAVLLLRRRDS